MQILPKLVVLLGPTASGKTAWGLKFAERFLGEIISADSRQMYRKMDIGTAKEPGQWRGSGSDRAYSIQGVRHHLIDFLDPGKSFAVAEFRDAVFQTIPHIYDRGHVPFLVGGTGLYISSVVDNWEIPRVPPNKAMRKSLEEKSEKELSDLLQSIDPDAALNIDPRNKRRVIRALEVSILGGELFSRQQKKGKKLFDALQIGIETPRDVLYDRIERRIDRMMERGLLRELEGLVRQKYDWALPSMSGIGYKEFRPYLEGKSTLETCVEVFKRDTRHFARRQLTWFRRDKTIQWCSTYKEAEKLVEEFLVTAE